MEENSSDDLAVQVLRKMQNSTSFATVSIPEGITLQEPSDAALVSRSASILTSSFVPSSLGQTAISAEGIIIGTTNGLDSFAQLLAAADTSDMGHCSSASLVADLSPILGTPITMDGTGMAAHSLHPVLATSVNSLDPSMQIIDDLRPADPLPLSGSEAMTITVHCTMLDAVFVVGQQNWQCCMCRELYGFDVSIDQHLAQKHERPLGRSFSAPEDIKVPSSGNCNSIIFPQSDLKEIVSAEPFQTIAEQALASLNLSDGPGSAARTGLEKEVALLMAQTFTQDTDRIDKGAIVKKRNDDQPDGRSNMYNHMNSASKTNEVVFDKLIKTVEKAMLYANDNDTRKDLQLVASELGKMQKEAAHKDWLRKNSRYSKCPECNKQVRNNRYLIKQHNRSHEKTKKYRCRVCNKMFKYMHTLRRHVSQKNHVGGLTLEADINNTAREAIASTAGKHNIDSIDNIVKAYGSDNVFKPVLLANDTLLTSAHSNIQPEDKNVCENFKTIIWDSGTPAYEKILATLLSKGENNRNSRGNKLSLVQCFVCDREIRNRKYYISRHARTHLEALCFTCSLCHLEFYRSDHYQIHVNSHKNSADFDKHIIAEANDHKKLTDSFSQETERSESKNLLTPSTVSCKLCGKGILNRTYNIKRHAKMHSLMEWDSVLASVAKGYKISKALARSHPIQCRVCDMTFKSYSLKRRHMLKHRSTFKCHHCSSRFETGVGFHTHIQTCTKTLKKINSISADNVTATLKQNPESSVKVVEGTKFVCSVCNASIINTTQSINRHMRELHSEGQPNVCGVCSRVFNSYQKLQRHFKSHGDKGGICDVCGKVFLSKTALRNHTKLHGSAEGMFQCPKCPKSFRFQGRLDKHLLKHAQRADLCPHCGKVYISKIHLRRHISVVHLGVKDYRYKCDCGAQFFESVQLRDHIAYRHKGVKLYTCKFCKKSFNCRPTMIRHERKEHTNDLPYKCQHCLQGFPEKSKLVSHEMTHTGISPHKCDVCGKYFTTGSALKAHKNLHLGVKPFVCTFCPKTYLKNWHLQQHVRKSHCKIVDIPDAPLGQQRIAESFMIFDPLSQEVVLQNADKQGTSTAVPSLAHTS